MTVNTLGSHEQDRSSRTAAEWLWPLLPIGISVFFLSALIYYHLRHEAVEVRSVLQVAVAGIYQIAGFAPAILCFLLALTWSSIWFATGQLERPVSRVLRLLAMTLMLSVFLNVGDGGLTWQPHKGQLGAWFAGHLQSAFGYLPSLVLVWAVTFASLLLATDFFFSESFERLRKPAPKDLGVEIAVTDHLRGLGQSVPAPQPNSLGRSGLVRPPRPADALATAGELAFAAGLAPGPDLEAAAPASTIEDAPFAADAEPRRRSHFERRREHDPSAEGVPAAPDSQASDSPETVPGATGVRNGVEDIEIEAAEVEVEVEEIEAEIEAADAVDIEAEVHREPVPVPLAEVVDEEEPEADPAADRVEPFAAEAAEPQATAEDPAEPEPGEPDTEEPLVQIPRPAVPPVWREATAPGQSRATEEPPGRTAGRQQDLFLAGIDEGLIQEAIDLVTGTRRASAALLQRKLRIDYARALDLLGELAARGLVALEGDASQGRVLGP